MTMKIEGGLKAVLFDLDGTLLNTLDDLAASTNAALAANGMPQRTTDEVRRFVGNGLYILDEPESALSPQRLMSLLVAMDDLVKRGSQLIIATHSPILMAYPNAEILQFSESGIQRVSYKETEHYKITKQFIDTPERMIRYLLGQ